MLQAAAQCPLANTQMSTSTQIYTTAHTHTQEPKFTDRVTDQPEKTRSAEVGKVAKNYTEVEYCVL